MRKVGTRAKDPEKTHYPPRYAYEISSLNRPQVTALSILSLTDSTNFSKRREQMMYTILGIGEGKEIKDRSRKKILTNLISPLLKEGLRPHDFQENAERLSDGLLKEELTPYEATGIIKELCPDLKSKKMTELWTKFSIVTGIRHLKDEALKNNWSSNIEEDSIKPKLKALKQSLIEPPYSNDPTIVKKKYYENYSHLKSSKGANTNWSEVLSNLNHEQAGFIKALLCSSKNSILKEEATKNVLWPMPIEQEIENKRLNTLLNTLGNRPTGRIQRYNRILLNQEKNTLPKNIPEPTPIALTRKEKEVEKNFIHNLERLKDTSAMSEKRSQPWYHIFLKIGKMRKINSDTAQNAVKKAEELLVKYCQESIKIQLKEGNSIKKENFYIRMLQRSSTLRNEFLKILLTTRLTNEREEDLVRRSAIDLIHGGDFRRGEIPDSLIVSAIEHTCSRAEETIKDDEVLKLHLLLKDPHKLEALFRNYPYTKSRCLSQASNRELDPPSSWTPKRFKDIYESNTKNTALNLKETYGNAKLSALHLASWYSGSNGNRVGAELSAIVEQMSKDHLNLSPKDILGNTPLHRCSPYAAEELLNAGANPGEKNNAGQTPAKTNLSKEICKKLLLEAAKKQTIKQIASSPSLDL